MAITLRAATGRDLPVLVAAQRAIAATPGRLRAQPAEITEAPFAQALAAAHANRGCFLVAQEDGALRGHGWLIPGDVAAQAHLLRLQLAVHEGHQGLGIGRQLLHALLRWSDAQPTVAKVELRVRADNVRAVRLYRACGFHVEGRLVATLRLPDGRVVDDLAMARFAPGTRPTTAWKVRDATAHDLPAIGRLTDEINAAHHAHVPHLFTPRGHAEGHQTFWAAHLSKGDRIWVVAHDDGAGVAVVAFASASRIDDAATSITQAMRFVRVGSVGVAPALQGHGIGTALMQTVVDFARAEGAREIRLNVFDFNQRAQALYRRLGFAVRSSTMVLDLAD